MIPSVAAAVLVAVTSARSTTDVEVGHGHERLTAGFDEWTRTWIAFQRTGRRGSAGVAFRAPQRFGMRDRELALSARSLVGETLGVSAEASVAIPHATVPAWTAAIGADRALGHGFAGSCGVRLARYDGGSARAGVAMANASIERYWGAYRVAGTGYVAGVRGAWSASGRIAFDLFYGERGRVGVAAGYGDELESVAGEAPIATRVVAAAIAGVHELGAEWGVVYDVAVQRQGDLYTRAGVSLAIRLRF